jgi:hypothetical protein
VAKSTINGETSPYTTTFDFHPDHTVKALGPAGPDGTPSFTGTGHWIARPDGTFIYHVTHPLPDHTGGPDMGTIYSIQQVTVTGDSHESTGCAIMHKADGSVQEPIAITLCASR